MKPEHPGIDRRPKTSERNIDEQLRDSFPASDPPSFNPGTAGAPNESGAEESTDGKIEIPRRKSY